MIKTEDGEASDGELPPPPPPKDGGEPAADHSEEGECDSDPEEGECDGADVSWVVVVFDFQIK